MIRIYKKTVKDRKLKIIKNFKVGSWINVENPTKKELDDLAQKFHLERDLLEDAIDPNEVPRLETENKIIYAFARVPHKEDNRIVTIPVLVGLGQDFLLTLSQKPLPFLKKFTESNIDFYTTQKTRLFIQIFFEINNAYNKFITDINRHVRGLSVRLEKIKNKDILQFVIFEGILNDFLSSLTPIHSFLDTILLGKLFKLYENDKDLIEDLSLGNGQLIEICKLNLKSIVNIRESYSTIMTNNLNRVIRILTALTIVLTIPTIIASIYGMNITLPFADSPLAFIWIIGITVIISLITLGIFTYNRWL